MRRILSLFRVASLLLPATFGRVQPLGYARDLCVKAGHGKLPELRAFMLDSVAKSAKYRLMAALIPGLPLVKVTT